MICGTETSHPAFFTDRRLSLSYEKYYIKKSWKKFLAFIAANPMESLYLLHINKDIKH